MISPGPILRLRPCLLLLAAGLLLLTGPLTAFGQSRPQNVYNIGFFPYMFGGAPESDAIAAFKYWVQIIGTESGVNVTSSSRVFASHHEAIESARAGTTDIIAFSSVDYLAVQDQLPRGAIISPVRFTGPTERYVLVTHADHPGQSLADFAGKPLNRQSLSTAMLGPLWLATVLHEAGLPPAAEFFAETRVFPKPAKVVLPVFFRQVDLCLTTRAAYDTLCELNPQVKRQTRILAESPPLITSLVWVALPAGSPMHERAAEAIRHLQNTPSGRQTLLLFQFRQMEDCPDAMLDTTRDLLRRLPPGVRNPTDYLHLKE